MLGEILADKMRHNDAYERAMQEWMAKDRTFKSDGSRYPSREETHLRR
jgi:hypothetical protein